MIMTEQKLEQSLIAKLKDLKYTYRPDIRDRAALEDNFRRHFEALNHVQLTDDEFKRLLDEIISPDVFTAATRLREINSFTRDDGTPLNYTLVNIKDWCKNTFEVVNQLRINTDYSFQRYDVILLINGIPAVQIELKTLGISPRRAMQQIVDYKKTPATATPGPCSALSSSSSSPTRPRPTTSPITTTVILPSTLKKISCPSTSTPTRTTPR
jgi:Type I site-specific restriction-modification system, R (restriction) subunit and related helicases